jgi:hypothetical protein
MNSHLTERRAAHFPKFDRARKLFGIRMERNAPRCPSTGRTSRWLNAIGTCHPKAVLNRDRVIRKDKS